MDVLIVDADTNSRKTSASLCRSFGYRVLTARNFNQAEKNLHESNVDALIVELGEDTSEGLSFLDNLSGFGFSGTVLACTDNASIGDVVSAMKKGAFTFLQKPIAADQLKEILEQMEKDLEQNTPEGTITPSASRIGEKAQDILLESNESSMQEVFSIVEKAAATEASILLLGPSGTGKTVMARQIHEASLRKDKPFLTVSCPSLSGELLDSELFGYVKGAFTGAVKDTDGKVHAAMGGTLFLDEIGDLPMELQPKLLRLLQSKEFERVGDTETRIADVRLITATNKDLQSAVEKRKFREDLFYRLNVITINMPALKDRQKDLPMLIDWFLDYFKEKHGRNELSLSERSRKAAKSYEWPGNLREMANAFERAVILCEGEQIDLEDLGEDIQKKESIVVEVGSPVPLSEVEKAHIIRIMENASSLEEASDTLDIDSATLYRKRKRLGLD